MDRKLGNVSQAGTSLLTWMIAIGAIGVLMLAIIAGAIGLHKESSKASIDAAAERDRIAAMTPDEKAEELHRREKARNIARASYACRSAISEQLHDPFSVKWDETPAWYAMQNLDGTINVQPRARAKNALGAYIHSTWDCKVSAPPEMNVVGLRII